MRRPKIWLKSNSLRMLLPNSKNSHPPNEMTPVWNQSQTLFHEHRDLQTARRNALRNGPSKSFRSIDIAWAAILRQKTDQFFGHVSISRALFPLLYPRHGECFLTIDPFFPTQTLLPFLESHFHCLCYGNSRYPPKG